MIIQDKILIMNQNDLKEDNEETKVINRLNGFRIKFRLILFIVKIRESFNDGDYILIVIYKEKYYFCYCV